MAGQCTYSLTYPKASDVFAGRCCSFKHIPCLSWVSILECRRHSSSRHVQVSLGSSQNTGSPIRDVLQCTYRPVNASVRISIYVGAVPQAHRRTFSKPAHSTISSDRYSKLGIRRIWGPFFSYNSFAFHLLCTLARRSSNYFHLAGEAKCHPSSRN